MWGQNCTRLFGVKKTLNRLSGIVCEISAINKHNIKVQHINLTNKQSTVKHPSHFCFVEYECTSVKVHHVIIVIICNTSIVREDTIFFKYQFIINGGNFPAILPKTCNWQQRQNDYGIPASYRTDLCSIARLTL